MRELAGQTDKKKKKKKSKKKMNRLTKITLILFLIILIIVLIGASGVFSVKEIEIKKEGNKIANEEIQSLSKITKGMNLFGFNSSEAEELIKKNPYIEFVEIDRKLNGKVIINVKERVAKYKINYAGGYILLDSAGYVLEIVSQDIEMPVLLGTSTDLSSLTVGVSENTVTRLNEDDLLKLEVVNNIMEISKNNDISGLISRIDITDDKNYILYLDSEQKIVYLGDCSELNTRILCMKEIVKKETGIKGEIFINGDLNINKPRFRESV